MISLRPADRLFTPAIRHYTLDDVDQNNTPKQLESTFLVSIYLCIEQIA